jgi:hypothetical protein
MVLNRWIDLARFVWTSLPISIRYTHQSTYLRSIWVAEMLPPSLGLTGSVRWFLDRLEPLALNPGGTALSMSLWISAIGGWAFGVRRPLGFVLAAVPLSAFAFAAVVPLHQRFSLWMVPALYAGVALLVDRAVALGSHAFARRRWPLLAAAMLLFLVPFRLSADIFTRGKAELDARRHSTDKHRLDDRAAVRWLMSQWEPGDALMTTHLALPAVWWYGMIPVSDDAGAGGVLRDGSPIYEVGPTRDCPSRQLEDTLRNHSRVLLYLGFDVVPGFDEVLLRDLAQLGGMTEHRKFGGLGRAAVIDLRIPASDGIMELNRNQTPEHADPDACVGVRLAERW